MKIFRAFLFFAFLYFGVEPPQARADPFRCGDNCECGCLSQGKCDCLKAGSAAKWKQWPDSREYALTRGGKQIGAWNGDTGVFRRLRDDGSWGPKEGFPADAPPINPEAEGGPVAPDGTEVKCEVPVEFRTRNIGSRVDGSGMCVTTSTSVAAKWSGLDEWVGIRDWAAKFPGGSYPSKHLSQLAKYGTEKNLGEAPWAQYVGKNPGPFLDAVLGSGRVACVSWMNGGHWLNLVHLDAKNACIMDNNGDPNSLKWMTRDACIRQINSPYAWVGCWLNPGPPPPPRNRGGKPVRRAVVAYGAAPVAGGCDVPGVYLVAVEGDEYTLRGKPSNIDELKAVLGTGQEPRLTVIGDGAQVLADLSSPALSPLRGKLAISSYPANHWSVALGHVATGKPTIYLQSVDGVVLFRRDSYEGGPDALAGAIRRADPAYDPKLDPSGNPPSPLGLKWPENLPSMPVCCVGAVGLYLLMQRKK